MNENWDIRIFKKKSSYIINFKIFKKTKQIWKKERWLTKKKKNGQTFNRTQFIKDLLIKYII